MQWCLFYYSKLLNGNKISFLCINNNCTAFTSVTCLILSVAFSRSWKHSEHENVINSWDKGTKFCSFFMRYLLTPSFVKTHQSEVGLDSSCLLDPPLFVGSANGNPLRIGGSRLSAEWGGPRTAGIQEDQLTWFHHVRGLKKLCFFSIWGPSSQRDSWHRRDARPADGKECAEEVIFSCRVVGGNSPRRIARPRASLR